METFEFARARDVADAVESASRSSTAQQGATVRFLAGGSTLVDLMKLGVERPERLVDINRLGLDAIEEENGGLRIGATARNSDLAHHPVVRARYRALSEALLSGASGQLRNVATTAGNLLQRTRCAYFRDLASACNKRDPGAGCDAIGGFHRMHAILGTSDACIATHPSDMAVAMLAYDAVVRVRGRDGDRDIPLSVFYRLPGSRPDCENALAPGDLITSVLLPPTRSGERAVYLKLRDRASYEFALASAAVVLAMDGERISAARFALGGVGTKPWRVPAAEAALAGRAPSEALFEEAASIALTGARPLPQNAFKVELARRCLRQAFRNALS